MGCSQSQPVVRSRQDSKSSIKSSFLEFQSDDISIVAEILFKCAFFQGLDRIDLTRLVQKAQLPNEAMPLQSQVDPGQHFIVGGVGLELGSGVFIAKRRDIYGEDCFLPPLPPAPTIMSSFRSGRSRERRESSDRRSRRESLSSSRDGRESPAPFPYRTLQERTGSREDLLSDLAEVSLKLVRLEHRPIVVFSRADIEALTEISETFRDKRILLERRARYRLPFMLQRNGSLSLWRSGELKSFGSAMDFCTLDYIQKQQSNSANNFYMICDGALDIVVNHSQGSEEEDSGRDTNVIAGRLTGGCFISETTALLQTNKRFSNKITYRVAEKGVALVVNPRMLENFKAHILSEGSKQALVSESKARLPTQLKKVFPVFLYLSDEMCELLMEACVSTMLAGGDEVPRPQDLHFVRRGAVMTTGTIRRRSLGGILMIQPSNSSSGSDSNMAPPMTSVIHEGEFFSHECLIRLFSKPKPFSTAPLGSDAAPSSPGEAPPVLDLNATSRPQSQTLHQDFSSAVATTPSAVATALAAATAAAVTTSVESSPATPRASREDSVTRSPMQPEATADSLTSLRAINPDTIIWTLPGDLVAFVCSKEPIWAADFEIRALKENASVESILRHPVGAHYFRLNLTAFHAEENLDFYLAAKSFSATGSLDRSMLSPSLSFSRSLSGRFRMREQSFSPRQGPSSGGSTDGGTGGPSPDEAPGGIDAVAQSIFNEFIDEGSPRQINIASAIRNEIKQVVLHTSPVPRNVFTAAMQECLKILSTDSFPRFRTSKLFEEMLRDIANGSGLREVMAAQDNGSANAAKRNSLTMSSPIMAARKKLSRATSPGKPTRSLGGDSSIFDFSPSGLRREASGSFDITSLMSKGSRREELGIATTRQREDSKDSADSNFSVSKLPRKRDDSTDVSKQRGDSMQLAMDAGAWNRNDSTLGTIQESPTQPGSHDASSGYLTPPMKAAQPDPRDAAGGWADTFELEQLPTTAISSPQFARTKSLSLASSGTGNVVNSKSSAHSGTVMTTLKSNKEKNETNEANSRTPSAE